MDPTAGIPSGTQSAILIDKLVAFTSLIVKKVDAAGDSNAAMLYLVAQLGKTFANKLRHEDPAKLTSGIDWLKQALDQVCDPTISAADFERWASS